MAHVKVSYCEEEFWVDDNGDGGSFPESKFIEGDFKEVEWDGEKLTLDGQTIITQALSTYGTNDIEYLEIDGTVYRDVRPETLKKAKEEHEQRLVKFLEDSHRRRKED